MSRTYWLDLFTGTTWQEFVDAGAKVSGFRDRQRSTVEMFRLDVSRVQDETNLDTTVHLSWMSSEGLNAWCIVTRCANPRQNRCDGVRARGAHVLA